MAKVVLILPAYSTHVYGKVYDDDNIKIREIRPPLSLMALSGYLKSFGHDVAAVDGEPELLSVEETVERALAHNPDFVGVTSTTPEYPTAHKIIRRVKELRPDVVTILGGSHITNLPTHTVHDLGEYLDWGVIYEGEKALRAIVEGYPEKYLWRDGYPNLLMAKDRLNGHELESFMPDRATLDMTQYRYVLTSTGLVQHDAIEMARGCPFSCAFCTSRRTKMAARSTDHVIKEILYSSDTVGTKLFMFYDDTFTLDKNKAMDLFQEIIRLKRVGRLPEDTSFYGFTRANTLHDWELLRVLKDAGCDKITMGIESGSESILRSTMKGTTLDDYRIAYQMMDEIGLAKRGSIIVGHPFETEETVRESIDFVKELDLDEIGVNIMTPYPGQLTFRHAMEAKGIWFSHNLHFSDLREGTDQTEAWSEYRSVNWHDYWRDHLRWGGSVVETEELSSEALVYWHSRFLQEVYGSEAMATRRKRHIEMGNNDEYWHRPWKVNAARNVERLENERVNGMPAFPEPLHYNHVYDPIPLVDFQKSELAKVKRDKQKPEQRAAAAY